jgi:hypothetical protein
LILYDEDAAAWMHLNNTFAGEYHQERYRCGLLFHLGYYTSADDDSCSAFERVTLHRAAGDVELLRKQFAWIDVLAVPRPHGRIPGSAIPLSPITPKDALQLFPPMGGRRMLHAHLKKYGPSPEVPDNMITCWQHPRGGFVLTANQAAGEGGLHNWYRFDFRDDVFAVRVYDFDMGSKVFTPKDGYQYGPGEITEISVDVAGAGGAPNGNHQDPPWPIGG